MQISIRYLIAGALACVGFSVAAQTVPYPSSNITLVVPFAAGSGTDGVARVVAERLGTRLGQTVVVDNKPGANAQIAAQFVARAKPDGYTLFMTTNTSHSANPWLVKALKYDPIKDFTPVARLGVLPFALLVNPSLPVHSVQELIDYAKANPDALSYGTPNSTSLVSSETLKFASNIEMVGVPYKSSPQALTDLMGNQIQVYVADLGSAMSTMKTDRVRTLGVSTAKTTPLLPDVPAIGETIAGFDVTSWNGIFGPANMPAEIAEKLNAELQVVLADPDTQQQLAKAGFEVWPSANPTAFASYVKEQLQLWGKLIQDAGIEAQ